MQANLEKYKIDLKKLVDQGELLHAAMQYECYPDEFKKAYGKDADKLIKSLPNFKSDYQSWYSPAKVLIKQLLPDRLADFVRH